MSILRDFWAYCVEHLKVEESGEAQQSPSLEPEAAKKHLEEALSELRKLQSLVAKVRSEAELALGTPLPEPVATDLKAIETKLSTAPQDNAVAMDKATDDAGDDLQDLDLVIKALTKYRSLFLANLALLESRITALDSHPQATVDFVKDQVDGIKKLVEDVKKQAAKGDYQEADQALLPIAARCGEVEGVADEHAHYTLMLADRQQRVRVLPPVPDGFDEAVTAVLERVLALPVQSLSNAEGLAASKNFKPAIGLLLSLPKLCVDANWTLKQAASYTTARGELKTSLSNAKSWKTDVQEAVDREAAVQKLYDDSDYSKTGDFELSLSMIGRGSDLLASVWKDQRLYNEMDTERTEAETAVQNLDGHDGAEGIIPERTRLNQDLLYAADKVTNHEYPTAKALYLSVREAAKKAKLIAAMHKPFKLKRKGVTDKHQIQSNRAVAAANDLLGEVQALVGSADNFVTARDYDSANKELTTAEGYLQDVKVVIDNFLVLENWKSGADPTIQQATTLPLPAFQKFKGIWDQVKTAVPATFNQDMSNALTKGERARDSSDPTLFTEALNDTQEVLKLRDKLTAYEGARNRLAARITTLKLQVRNNVFDGDLNTIDQTMSTAKDHADNRRYSEAMSTLTQAAGQVATAELETGKWDWYQNNRQAVKDQIDKVDTVEGRAAMDVEVQKLKDDLLEADKLRDQKKGVEAEKALRKLHAEAERLEGWLKLYKEARKSEKEKITDRIGQIENQPVVAKDLLEVEALKLQLAKMFTDRQFAEAVEMATYTIAWRMDLAISELGRFDAFEVERKKADTALQDLKKVACDANKLAIRALEVDYKKVESLATARNFVAAQELAAGIPARCVAPTQQGAAAAAANTSHKTASDAIDTLVKDFPGLLDLQLELHRSRLKVAADLATKADFVGAKKVTDEITTAAVELRKLGTAQATLEQDQKDLSGKTGPDGLTEDIQKLRSSAQKLQGRADVFLKDHLARIERLLTTSESEAAASKPEPARAALNDAAAAIAHANELVEEFLQSEGVIKEAADGILGLKGQYTVPPRLVEALDRLDKELGFARLDSAGAMATTAIRRSLSVLGELRELGKLGADHALYVAERKKVDPRVAKLATSKARFTIAKELGEIRATLVEADNAVNVGDYIGAKDLVRQAVEQLDTSELTVAMHENEEVKPEMVRTILAQPGGEKKLDTLIKGLDPQAQRKVAKVALEERFQLKLELFTTEKGDVADTNMDKNAPDILRFYAMMQALPASHTKDNPNLSLIKHMGDTGASGSYSKYSREVKLQIGKALEKKEEIIGLESQLGPIDDDAKPPTGGEPPTTFDWTTLHEIGHAVDDRLGFMKGKAGQTEFGGWREYGANVSEIATAAGKHFDYPASYIEAYLYKQKMDPPADPNNGDPVAWERLRFEVEAWCDAIRHDKGIYWSAAATNRAKLKDGRIYQEAYDGRWVSYLADARKKGVAGYQFRAPGEWFAEIYAAYYSGHLNPKHPAGSWLKSL